MGTLQLKGVLFSVVTSSRNKLSSFLWDKPREDKNMRINRGKREHFKGRKYY